MDCAWLIVTGAPDNTQFGIDLLEIKITNEFRGFKFIPHGPHFVYSSSTDQFGNPSVGRSGFLHFFKPGEILVKEWNNETEELQDRTITDADTEKTRIKENLKNLDRYLAMYDYENLTKWKRLTDLLTEEAIVRMSPTCKIIRNSIEFKSCSDKDRPKGSLASPIRNVRIRNVGDEAMYLPKMEVISSTLPKFSQIPERYNKNSTPKEKTLNNIDTIHLIDKLLNEITSESKLLEEVQFSFVVYMCCLSIESLAHWRQIVCLLCNSEQAVEKYPSFYRMFINVIKNQIAEIPIEFIEQGTSNTIYMDIRALLRNLMLNNDKEIAESLQKHLDKTIAWTFTDLLEEDPEDLPQVVEAVI